MVRIALVLAVALLLAGCDVFEDDYSGFRCCRTTDERPDGTWDLVLPEARATGACRDTDCFRLEFVPCCGEVAGEIRGAYCDPADVPAGWILNPTWDGGGVSASCSEVLRGD